MLGRRSRLPEPTIVRFTTPQEAGEHDALEALHEAKNLADRAGIARLTANRLTEDAEAALAVARKDLRRISER